MQHNLVPRIMFIVHFTFIKYLKCINFHVFSMTENKMLGSMNRTKNNFDYLSIHIKNLLSVVSPLDMSKKMWHLHHFFVLHIYFPT